MEKNTVDKQRFVLSVSSLRFIVLLREIKATSYNVTVWAEPCPNKSSPKKICCLLEFLGDILKKSQTSGKLYFNFITSHLQENFPSLDFRQNLWKVFSEEFWFSPQTALLWVDSPRGKLLTLLSWELVPLHPFILLLRLSSSITTMDDEVKFRSLRVLQVGARWSCRQSHNIIVFFESSW